MFNKDRFTQGRTQLVTQSYLLQEWLCNIYAEKEMSEHKIQENPETIQWSVRDMKQTFQDIVVDYHN